MQYVTRTLEGFKWLILVALVLAALVFIIQNAPVVLVAVLIFLLAYGIGLVIETDRRESAEYGVLDDDLFRIPPPPEEE